ncbi:hypothetical protein DL96DRAFT_1711202 [Flagelloscypha sp. PMI_526]|nr:hypothetical protein DL96DRAFT_1711202 [Flagelloscypha sp. PMI_526]
MRPASRVETGLNAAGAALQLAKDVGEAASQVPYVKAVAGVLFQIIRIREEIQTNKERCREIISLIELKATTILQCLDKVYSANGAKGCEDVKSDLEEYARHVFLQVVLRDELEPWKRQSRWMTYVNRATNTGDLQRLKQELDEFQNRFFRWMLVLQQHSSPDSSSPADVVPHALPAFPKLVLGRNSVVETVVQDITSSTEPRTAILGHGGIGKTTIATTVLHDSRIAVAYPIRYSVSRELAPTIDLLLTKTADALSIPQANRGLNLASLIVHHICSDTSPVLLCIDNLETVWEVGAEQAKVDNFLEVLSGLGSKLAILVTMRGIQEPKTSFPWSSTILSGLVDDDSAVLYETLSKKPTDAPARELLTKLSGSPLAIKLFALMVKEGDSPSQLLSSWDEYGTKALEIGGVHRLSSLEHSIHLSVFSPRIDDTARLILGLIAHMPDGLSTSQPWFKDFMSLLPDGATLQPALRTLRRAALLEENGEPSRWQMLSPVRQFCLRLSDSTSATVASLVQLYIDKVMEHWDCGSPTSQVVIFPEMASIRSLLLHGSTLQFLPIEIGAATAFYDAAVIHHKLGDVHQKWNRLDAAKTSLHRALELFTEVGDKSGQAYTLGVPGVLEERRDQLDAAEASFRRALALYIELQDRSGEANTHISIGNLHLRRDQLVAAETSFTCALDLHVEIQNQLGKANTYMSFGNSHMRQNQMDLAEASFIKAQNIYLEVQSPLGEANTHTSIGEVLLRRGHLDAAEASFTPALEQYIEIQDQWGIGSCRYFQGQIHIRRHGLEVGSAVFDQLLTPGKETSQGVGGLSLESRHLIDAEASLTLALDIFASKVESRIDEALVNRCLSEVYLHRGHFEDCERVLQHALELDIAASSRVGQGQSHRCLGEMFLKKGDLDAAESSYEESLRLFFEIGDYQATPCLIDLGKVWALQGKIEENDTLDASLLRIRWDATNASIRKDDVTSKTS